LNALLKADKISATEVSRASILTASGLPRTRISASAGVVAVAKAPPSKIAARIPKLRGWMMRTGTIAKLVNSNLLKGAGDPVAAVESIRRISRAATFMKTMNVATAATARRAQAFFSSNAADARVALPPP
jgi:hypothetical protein